MGRDGDESRNDLALPALQRYSTLPPIKRHAGVGTGNWGLSALAKSSALCLSTLCYERFDVRIPSPEDGLCLFEQYVEPAGYRRVAHRRLETHDDGRTGGERAYTPSAQSMDPVVVTPGAQLALSKAGAPCLTSDQASRQIWHHMGHGRQDRMVARGMVLTRPASDG